MNFKQFEMLLTKRNDLLTTYKLYKSFLQLNNSKTIKEKDYQQYLDKNLKAATLKLLNLLDEELEHLVNERVDVYNCLLSREYNNIYD